ncbi:hypothetical protein LCGC14_1596130 [marine sediment metagenome]|uniref:Uncharacterized protein n=1 Tax=marine sediment metagenome TaxID=412755 RepID=A0A0F9ICK7_9ZZZZ
MTWQTVFKILRWSYVAIFIGEGVLLIILKPDLPPLDIEPYLLYAVMAIMTGVYWLR